MTALVTGATSGIGRDMAIYLASLGWDLVLTGRNESELLRLKDTLNVKVDVLNLDLSTKQAPFVLYKFCRNKNVEMLINNAGFGIYGNFNDVKLDTELKLINVNIRTVHILTKLFLRDFVERDSGVILNVSSCAGFVPGPRMSAYYASKSYVLRLTQAIYMELKRAKSKVKISAFCPGPVKTDFNARAGAGRSINAISSEYAAKYAIDMALNGKVVVIPNIIMKASVCASRLIPDNIVTFAISIFQDLKRR